MQKAKVAIQMQQLISSEHEFIQQQTRAADPAKNHSRIQISRNKVSMALDIVDILNAVTVVLPKAHFYCESIGFESNIQNRIIQAILPDW